VGGPLPDHTSDDVDSSHFLDQLLDGRQPLPHYDDHLNADYDVIIPTLLQRAGMAIDALEHCHASRRFGWVRVGGNAGLLMAMRFVEFSRRLALKDDYADLQDEVDSLIARFSRVLPKEMFRRWTDASLHKAYHENAGDVLLLWKIYMETLMHDSIDSAKVRTSSRHHHEPLTKIWNIVVGP
jgi:hypothetical protein